jgi:hypothetical protein
MLDPAPLPNIHQGLSQPAVPSAYILNCLKIADASCLFECCDYTTQCIRVLSSAKFLLDKFLTASSMHNGRSIRDVDELYMTNGTPESVDNRYQPLLRQGACLHVVDLVLLQNLFARIDLIAHSFIICETPADFDSTSIGIPCILAQHTNYGADCIFGAIGRGPLRKGSITHDMICNFAA